MSEIEDRLERRIKLVETIDEFSRKCSQKCYQCEYFQEANPNDVCICWLLNVSIDKVEMVFKNRAFPELFLQEYKKCHGLKTD